MRAILLVVAALAMGVKAWGHHSFAAVYLEDQEVTIEGRLVQFLWRNPHTLVHVMVEQDQEVTIEGRLVQFLWRNPHTLVHVMVEQDDGSNVRYVVEWGSATQLGATGVRISKARRLRGDQRQSRPQRGGQPRPSAQLPSPIRWPDLGSSARGGLRLAVFASVSMR